MAGPNGSGKSTVLSQVRESYYCGPFLNADEIEKSLKTTGFYDPSSALGLPYHDEDFNTFMNSEGSTWIEKARTNGLSIGIFSRNGILQTHQEATAYDGALAAQFLRKMFIRKGDSFTIETVLSDRSKITLLEDSIKGGFKNYLYFICTVDPKINLKRVKNRAIQGGHDVPKQKIIERYNRSLLLLKEVIPLCHRVYFYDNSITREDRKVNLVAEIDPLNKFFCYSDDLPMWLNANVIQPLFGGLN